MAKRRGLGRGLDALLGEGAAAHVTGDHPQPESRAVPVDLIDRGAYQPRGAVEDESLDQLADSIRTQGVLQPVLLRPRPGGRYELVAGERRWRAAQRVGLEEVPAQVRELSDEATAVIGLIENVQREDLNPVEEARALRRLVDEFGLTHQAVSEAVGRSRVAVTNLLRLLEVDAQVRDLLEREEIDMGHARAILGLPVELQGEAAAQVVSRGLSARETERLVRTLKSGAGGGKAGRRRASPDPDVRRLQERLASRLGAPVEIRHSPSGRGRLVIKYASLDELDGILERVGAGVVE